MVAVSRSHPEPDIVQDTVHLPALRVAGIYLAISAAWILLSDHAANWLIDDPAVLVWIQTLKGGGFVAVTAVIIYALVHRSLKRHEQVSRELRTRQAQLAHANRVTLAGELSGSLVHELAQPLDAITLYAETAVEQLQPGDHLRQPLQAMVEQARRARGIIERLRAFLRKRDLTREAFDLVDLLEQTRPIIQPDLQRMGVRLRRLDDGGVHRALGDRIQIQQVLVNLILNAAEAMAQAETRRPVIDVYIASDDGQCLVTIADNGPGVPEARRGGLFEAFNTSKSEGLGLGLAISRSILRSHGGELWHEPRASGGAAFLFTLPEGADT